MNFENSVFGNVLNWDEASLGDFGININDFSEEAKIIEDLRKLKSSNNWKEVRSEEKFELLEKQFSFGKRKVYVPKETKSNVNLQQSRGVTFDDNETLESTLKRYLSSTENMSEANILRIQEIEKIESHIQKDNVFQNLLNACQNENEKAALKKAFIEKTDSFVEIGFRVPALLNFFKKINYETTGYDINPLSVSICKKLGWNVYTCDLNDNDNTNIKLKEGSLVVCYHVLEHVSDPLNALKNILKNSPPGIKFHFEIPIEPGVPRLNYGHMFPFEKGDLQKMLIEAGYIPVSFSNVTHPGGPEIERILAISK